MTSLRKTYLVPARTGLPSCSRQLSPCRCRSANPVSGVTLATVLLLFPAHERSSSGLSIHIGLAFDADHTVLSMGGLLAVQMR